LRLFAGIVALVRNPWFRFILRRLVALFFVLFALIVVVFFMVHLVPGDPAFVLVGLTSTPADVARIHHQLGLDRPILTQLWTYIDHALHGDLGRSYIYGQPVGQLIRQRVGQSLQLALAGLVIVLTVGMSLGIAMAAYTRDGRHRRAENGFVGVTSIVGSLPEFLTATVLAYLFAVKYRWLPVAGANGFKALILPAVAVSLAPTMALARIVRVTTLRVLSQDYIRTARSQRLPTRTIYISHVLPNVLAAALTIGGLIFAGLIGGAVIVENVFARAGIGTALVDSVTSKDYPVIQGITLLVGTVVVIANAIVEIVLAIIDPRFMSQSNQT
jgi:peptide/nickel transport system permease protein